MAIEEKEQQETLLKDLIEKVEKDPLPTNIFDISETDPLVLLGKMNEIISKLKAINALIASSDSKASEALSKAITALSQAGEALGRAMNAENLSQDATDKADLAISDALSAVSTAQEALSKAETADSTAIEAINDATEALSKANEALTTANEASATANTANTTANTANTTANTANTTALEAKTSAQNAVELATSAEETAGNASMQATDANNKSTDALSKANQALTTAQEALEQVTEGLGTKVFDNHNNLMSNAKFTGHNGVNVDMSESDPETFDIRLDNSITSAIEDNHTQGQTNKANIEALTTRVTANEGDIVELTNMLSATEELAQGNNEQLEKSKQYFYEALSNIIGTTTDEFSKCVLEYLNRVTSKFNDQNLSISNKVEDVTLNFSLINGYSIGINYVVTKDGKTIKNRTIPIAESDGYSYIRFKNGIQICWGSETSGTLFTFPRPFSSTQYVLLALSDNGDWETLWRMATSSSTQGGVQSRYNSRNIRYFAIGTW